MCLPLSYTFNTAGGFLMYDKCDFLWESFTNYDAIICKRGGFILAKHFVVWYNFFIKTWKKEGTNNDCNGDSENIQLTTQRYY